MLHSVCTSVVSFRNKEKQPERCLIMPLFYVFYFLLTAHLGIILVNNQLDVQFLSVYVYFDTLHVSSNHVLIIGRLNCINTTSGICHSV